MLVLEERTSPQGTAVHGIFALASTEWTQTGWGSSFDFSSWWRYVVNKLVYFKVQSLICLGGVSVLHTFISDVRFIVAPSEQPCLRKTLKSLYETCHIARSSLKQSVLMFSLCCTSVPYHTASQILFWWLNHQLPGVAPGSLLPTSVSTGELLKVSTLLLLPVVFHEARTDVLEQLIYLCLLSLNPN